MHDIKILKLAIANRCYYEIRYELLSQILLQLKPSNICTIIKFYTESTDNR